MAVRIKKNEEKPESAEILAEAIIKIADGFESLLTTPVNDDAIVQLLLGMPGMTVSKTDVRQVLRNLKTLKGYYLRK